MKKYLKVRFSTSFCIFDNYTVRMFVDLSLNLSDCPGSNQFNSNGTWRTLKCHISNKIGNKLRPNSTLNKLLNLVQAVMGLDLYAVKL